MRQIPPIIVFCVLLVVVFFSYKNLSSDRITTTVASHPVGVMGTSCTLCVTVKNRDVQKANELLRLAEREIRTWELYTSTWIETSEVSRFNRAKAGEKIHVSPQTLAFFQLSKKAYDETNGAFDITCGALWNLWAKCEKENRTPTESEIQNIRTESNWEALEVQEDSVLKKTDALSVVTGGIAKGMAVDAALRVLISSGVAVSAFVEIGGDVATFQCSDPIYIQNPNYKPSKNGDSEAQRLNKTVICPNGGICTSGHNARYFLIQGQKYSQILDPRTGQPVAKRWNITVTAKNAAEADYWATALEVLGKEGVSLCPEPKTVQFTDFLKNQD